MGIDPDEDASADPLLADATGVLVVVLDLLRDAAGARATEAG